mgnify:CR=1 FL=1|jgi:hypothetical protein
MTIKTIDQVVTFIDEQLKIHSNIEKEMHDEGDFSADDYRKGLVDSYIVIRYEITGKNR